MAKSNFLSRFFRTRPSACFDVVVPQLRGEAINIAMSAATSAYAIEGCVKLSERQMLLARTIENASRETTEAVDHVSGNAQCIAASTEETLQRARSTAESLREAAQQIANVDLGAQAFLESVQQVSDRCRDVEQVIEQINRIAQQTKILALNAAIEAASAGEKGKGFSVVAQAIRTLAEEVSDVTQRSKLSVALATKLSAQAATRSKDVRRDIQSILGAVNVGSTACDHILGALEGASTQFAKIAAAAEQMAAANMHVRSSIIQSMRMSEEVASRLLETNMTSSKLLASTENIQELLAGFEVGGGAFEGLLENCRSWRDIIQNKILEIAARGEDVFSCDYIAVHGTNPPQYNVGYQVVFEKIVRPVLDAARENTKASACVCTDTQGYLPTHNSEFSIPPSGDFATDTRFCRDKRIMTDHFGQRSAQYSGQLLLQTFVRDNGELTVEIALPIYIKGRRWGAVRFGFDSRSIAH